MKENDEFEKLQDWQDHQYNNPYWVNRTRIDFPPKRRVGMMLLSMIDLIIIGPAFIFTIVVIIVEKQPALLMLAGTLAPFLFVAILRVIRLAPKKPRGMSQQAIEAVMRKEKKDEKKQPKRRKDYN